MMILKIYSTSRLGAEKNKLNFSWDDSGGMGVSWTMFIGSLAADGTTIVSAVIEFFGGQDWLGDEGHWVDQRGAD